MSTETVAETMGWLDEYIAMHPQPNPEESPARATQIHRQLSDPHLAAVFQVALVVTQFGEGLWDMAMGLAAAVQGQPLAERLDLVEGEYAPGRPDHVKLGYCLGLMMVSAVGDGLGPEDGLGEPLDVYLARLADLAAADA